VRPVACRRTSRVAIRASSVRQSLGLGVAYACLLTAIGTATLVATLPSNILWERTQLPAVRAELNAIAGENFAFFTRSPESEQIAAYRLGSDGSLGLSLLTTPQAKAGNLYGLSRTQRAQGPELANLMRAVPADEWTDCAALDAVTCVDRMVRRGSAHLQNHSPIPTVCGKVVLTLESTAKWAYRRLATAVYTIDRIVMVNVDCARER
jgi:antimicrobial peptide system SdpA family protein